MRTDGVSLSAEAVDGLRDTIAAVYGPASLPAGGPRVYKSRAKNAQVGADSLTPWAVRGLGLCWPPWGLGAWRAVVDWGWGGS